MMNLLEEAIVYATIMHQGKVRKFGGRPFILHPLEVAQILSTLTDDMEVIAAGILHDVVEDTDGTLDEIQKRFGERVASPVDSETEDERLAKKCMQLVGALPECDTLVHGDFHTNNVFMMKDEPLLIDMDRVSRGHPIIELSDLYYWSWVRMTRRSSRTSWASRIRRQTSSLSTS
ncbi:MAG: HD domain-containing protein [Coriobacteriales bacterium]|nr:HD domain-containing protein [Coriobacteriales bacterium]